VQAFVIPTPSMENSLLVGDYLFVSKLHYGPQTPRTPLQLPLTHQKIWFTNIPSYLPWIQLPTYRFPGFTELKRGDAVVFNVPPISLNEGIDYPADLKNNYVKRCVAVAGDRLEIRNRQVIVNGVPLPNPPNMKFSYLVVSRDEINKRNLTSMDLDHDDYYFLGRAQDDRAVYRMFLTEDQAERIKAESYVTSLQIDTNTYSSPDRIFPSIYSTTWTGDNYGALVIPKKGMSIAINDTTLSTYGEVIRLYENNAHVSISNGTLMLDKRPVTQYTFKQNYYFMMGDNRHNSLDSRYWGFVPEDHIVGKPLFIWFSVNQDASLLNKVRWGRILNIIR
jgi:signal peptidase I